MSYPVSAAFLAAVRQSHRVATRLDVCLVDSTVLATVLASDGDVTINATRAVRRDCSFEIPDTDGTLTPVAQGSLLSSLSGNELRPYRGVTFADGTSELVPLGVFPIREVTPRSAAGGPTLTVGGLDRSSTITRNRWIAPYSITAGTALEVALDAIITDRAPLFSTNFPATGFTVPATTFGMDTENDPWADAQSLATAAGLDLFFDALGVAQLQQPLDPTTASPVISYADDSIAVIDSATKAWDATKGYNGCIAIGESSTSPPVTAVVWDDDPSSPTYYLGQYGAYPEFLVSPFITTADQALTAATAQRARRRGVAQNVAWTQLVNPALDAGDAVAFTNDQLKVSGLTVVIDSLTIPWRADATASATTRSRQVAA
jgi:hypothetical protein